MRTMAVELLRHNNVGMGKAPRRRLRTLALAGLSIVGLASCLPWRGGIVCGQSMLPTLTSGSLIVYDNGARRAELLAPGAVVVLKLGNQTVVKRVFATAGASFWAWRDRTESGAITTPIRTSQKRRFSQFAEMLRRKHPGADTQVVRVEVPAGHLFLIGDGSESLDSRQFGPVKADRVLGRVIDLPGQPLGDLPEWTESSFPTQAALAPLRAVPGAAGRSRPSGHGKDPVRSIHVQG